MADRYRDFVITSYETIKKVSPNTKAIFRLHNLGEWYVYNYHIDMAKLAGELPDDIMLETKCTALPCFDFSFRSPDSPNITGLGKKMIVTLGYDNRWTLCPSNFFFTCCHGRIQSDLNRWAQLENVCGIQFQNNHLTSAYVEHLLPLLGRLSWDTSLDAEGLLENWFVNRLGESSGKLVWEALRDSEQIAERLLPLPYLINGRKQLRPFYEFRRISPPYPYHPDGREIAPVTSALEFTTGKKEVAAESVKTFADKADAVDLSWQMHQKFVQAAEAGPKDAQLVNHYIEMAWDNMAWGGVLHEYVKAYGYWELAEKKGLLSCEERDLSFLHLFRALTWKHLWTGRYDDADAPIPDGKDFTYYYFRHIHFELDKFDWSRHIGPLARLIEDGQSIILCADDIPRRDVEGRCLLRLLGLKELPGNRIVPDDSTELYLLADEDLSTPGRIWYHTTEGIISRRGKGWVLYLPMEERDPYRHMFQGIPMPFMLMRQKRALRDLLRKRGFVPEICANGVTIQWEQRAHLPRLADELQWHGPLYSSAPSTETTRLYKLRRIGLFGGE